MYRPSVDRRRRVLTALVVPTCVFALLRCGSGTPVQPSDLTPTLAILSAKDVLQVHESVDVTVQVTFRDGRSTAITPDWGTDRPDVIAVKPLSASRQGAAPGDPKTGVVDHMLFARVTGLAPGSALITARSRYGDCSRPIRVVAE